MQPFSCKQWNHLIYGTSSLVKVIQSKLVQFFGRPCRVAHRTQHLRSHFRDESSRVTHYTITENKNLESPHGAHSSKIYLCRTQLISHWTMKGVLCISIQSVSLGIHEHVFMELLHLCFSDTITLIKLMKIYTSNLILIL